MIRPPFSVYTMDFGFWFHLSVRAVVFKFIWNGPGEQRRRKWVPVGVRKVEIVFLLVTLTLEKKILRSRINNNYCYWPYSEYCADTVESRIVMIRHRILRICVSAYANAYNRLFPPAMHTPFHIIVFLHTGRVSTAVVIYMSYRVFGKTSFNPKSIHVTFSVRRFAEEIRNEFSGVYKLISAAKNVFMRAPPRIQTYMEQLLSILPLPTRTCH